MDTKRLSVIIGGESGQGVNSIGELFANAIKRNGYKVFGYREYPSLIKGGFKLDQVASYQLDFSDNRIGCPSRYYDLAICISRLAVHKLLKNIKSGGTLLHSITKLILSDEELDWINEQKINLVYVDAREKVKELGGKSIMENIYLTGMAWKVLGIELECLMQAVKHQFSSKPEILELNIKCLEAGYRSELLGEIKQYEINFERAANWIDSYIISGNEVMGMGVITAGVRLYIGYPMTPTSSLLSFLSANYHKTGMVIKQAEDEITAAQMVIGAMHMGTRALTGTSGGGFDLMSESLSLAAMTETPFVCILGQRPGPATGLPTWTAAGDLNLAVFAGHGEFVRCVIAASDYSSAFLVIQKAFNIAEKYQIPVIVLTEKQIGESLYNFDNLPSPVEIERELVPDELIPNVKSEDRYKLTESGISPRWLPGQTSETFTGNSDEHFGYGRLTEDSVESKLMMEKRMRKEQFLLKELPEPELFGDESGDILFVGWGSVKSAVLDSFDIVKSQKSEPEAHPTLAKNLKCSYLHYEYVWPLKTERLIKLKQNFKRVVLIENNYLGQLGNLLRMVGGIEFEQRLLKYDGRGFFLEDILDFMDN